MLAGLDKIFLTLSTAEFIIGMSGNVFVGLVNCSEWIKNQKISFVDFILTGLALSRITQLLVSLWQSFVMTLSPPFYSTWKSAKLNTLLWRITNHWTTWFTTCLSIFYLLKIAHFSHSFFLWLKWRTNRVILAILVLSLPFLLFDFLVLESLNDFFLNVYVMDESNLTLHINDSKTLYIKTLILLSFSYTIPIVLSLTSLVLLFLSLVRHIRNLQLNVMDSRDPSTQAHKGAIKMVMSFLLLFTVHFFSIQLTNWMLLIFWNNKFTKFIMLAIYVFPSGHSLILILGNSKLRQTALKVLRHLKSTLKREKTVSSLQIDIPGSF
ncbi:taste receptor type 2 member 42-like [Herpailurus yagouaroundi]|uniref:taste receptor type 2 member 42-like n=1 Tax=Herpailurus yagouaroundi TaxID=1608482 RepID=UPI001AD7BE45|nr:taste receptor type 2 member 42-like [Puma yagouaroundi]